MTLNTKRMLQLFILSLFLNSQLVISFKSLYGSNSLNLKRMSYSKATAMRTVKSFFSLSAKKKGSKLVSDDLFAAFDTDETSSNNEGVQDQLEKDKTKTKKDKKQNSLIDVDKVLNLEIDSTETTDTKIEKSNQKKKDKKKGNVNLDEGNLQEEVIDNKGKKIILPKSDDENDTKFKKDNDDDNENQELAIEETSVIDDVITDEKAITVEQKIRKERPPARVRFAESSQPDFVMMQLENVGLVFGNNVVLKNASLSVTSGERVGLVGQNGGGKTTQLRILSGEIEPTTGDVIKSSRNLRVSFLRQEFIDELELKRSLREELRSAFLEERQIMADIEKYEALVAETTDDPEKMEEVLNKLAAAQEQAISRGVYALDSKIDKVMDAMGFSTSDQTALVETFSGGWKMRIGLAKILLQEPNILLLDEPTNHLDLDSVYWLEDFLTKQNIPMVIVSHDREFLDRVCNKIVEVEDGITYSYQGNYSKYLDQRRARLEIWKEQYEKQLRYIKEEENWIKKAKNDPSMSSQVKSRENSLEKFKQSDEIIPQPPKSKKFRFRFPPAPRCGANVVEVAKLTHGYGEGEDKTLFEEVEMEVILGDRVGFIGPNGSGKSTLMKIIAGHEDPLKGFSDFGSNNVVCNYFEQNQADCLDLDKTVLETVMDAAPSDYSLTDVRALLGQFMFKGDDADKKIRVLSGGEKARVSLCKMMLTPANLLLLDEPTNHLDITSKEVLEEAIQHYEGAVVVISHDRYFMSQIVNKLYVFQKKTLIRYDTDYHDYMEMQGESFKEKVTKRYVDGDSYKITNAKPVVVEQQKSTKKNFGGSGVTSGNLNKGIKNAKRFT